MRNSLFSSVLAGPSPWPGVALAVLLAMSPPLPAQRPGQDGKPPQPPRKQISLGWLDTASMAGRSALGQTAAGRSEFAAMLGSVLGGSSMGPGDGWFRPSQSRYDWKWLATHTDRDRDGRVSPSEFSGPTAWFARLDRDRDQVLTAADFDWSARSAAQSQALPSSMWFRGLDVDGNGRVSRKEWDALFTRAAGDKDYLIGDDLRDAFPVTPPKSGGGPPPKMPSTATLVKGLFNGELGSPLEGPAVGQAAPDFTLKTQNGAQEIRLSQFKGQKPVVLIFGSFT